MVNHDGEKFVSKTAISVVFAICLWHLEYLTHTKRIVQTLFSSGAVCGLASRLGYHSECQTKSERAYQPYIENLDNGGSSIYGHRKHLLVRPISLQRNASLHEYSSGHPARGIAQELPINERMFCKTVLSLGDNFISLRRRERYLSRIEVRKSRYASSKV